MKIFNYFTAIAIAIAISSLAHADHHLKPVIMAGVWNVEATTDDGDKRDVKWTIKKSGDKLTGSHEDMESGDERKIDRIVIKEKKVTLEIDIEMDGNKGVIRVEAKEKSPGKLDGEWSIVGEDGNTFMSGDMTATKELSLLGEWETIAILPDGGEAKSVAKFVGDNGKLKGMLAGSGNETKIEKARVGSGNKVNFEFDYDLDGTTYRVMIDAKPKGENELVGEWTALDGGSEAATGDWSAKRKPMSLAGNWDVVASVPNNADFEGGLMLAMKAGKYSGVSTGPNGNDTELKSVKVDGKDVVIAIPFEMDGNKGVITVTAKVKDDGSLDGEWALVGDNGNEYASGESWKATRKKK